MVLWGALQARKKVEELTKKEIIYPSVVESCVEYTLEATLGAEGGPRVADCKSPIHYLEESFGKVKKMVEHALMANKKR